jgi:hypothetical protein
MRIILIFLLSISFCYGQNRDTLKYTPNRDYGVNFKAIKVDSAFIFPIDTIKNKRGVAMLSNTIYVGNGTYWSLLSGQSQWTTTGNNIYYNAGNVGIKLTNPTYPLHVNGDINISGVDAFSNPNQYRINGGAGLLGNGSTYTKLFNPSGAEGLTLNSSGVLLGGFYSDSILYYNNGNNSLKLYGNITTAKARLDTTVSNGLVTPTMLATKGSGTVTSISTGLGLSGGTITNTGTLLVDTSSTSILSRQRAAATYQSIAAAITGNSPTITSSKVPVTYWNGTNHIGYTNGAVIDSIAGNLFVNNLIVRSTTVISSSTPISITASSIHNYIITGSTNQVVNMANATTLPKGAMFTFNNNGSTGVDSIRNSSGTLIFAVPNGGYATIILNDSTTAAGTWDWHFSAPSAVQWSTNTFNLGNASITNATWNGSVIPVNKGGAGAVTGILKADGSGNVSAATANTPITITSGVIGVDTITRYTGLATIGKTYNDSLVLATAINNKGVGTITGVTAGLNLTGGGTTGTVTLNADTTTGTTKLATQGFVTRNATNLTASQPIRITANVINADTITRATGLATIDQLVKDSTVLANGKLNISDTGSMLNGRINAITLNSSGVIHNSPINFTRLGGGWTGQMTLANQSAYQLFGTGNSTSTPTFRFIDSNYFNGGFATQVRGAVGSGLTGAIAAGRIPYGASLTTLSSKSNFLYDSTNAGGIRLGDTTITGTGVTNPSYIEFGANYNVSPILNPQIRFAHTSSTLYGIGVTTTGFNMIAPNTNFINQNNGSGSISITPTATNGSININGTNAFVIAQGFSGTAGQNPKYQLYQSSTGIGISGSSIDYTTGSTNFNHAFWINNGGTITRAATIFNTTGNLRLGTTNTDPSDKLGIEGNLSLLNVGNKLKIATGLNASVGTATLSSGTITVNTTAVTASSIILLTLQNCSNCGTPYISAKTAGTSFLVSSTNVLDGSIVAYQIIN